MSQNEQPFIIMECVDDGTTVVGGHIRQTEKEAIAFAMTLVACNETKKATLSKARKRLKKDWIWDDGYGWVIHITQATAP